MANWVELYKRAPLGRRLAALRALKGMKQEDAARAVSCAQTRLSRIEQGRGPAPSLRLLMRLAALYDIALDELVQEIEATTTDAACKSETALELAAVTA